MTIETPSKFLIVLVTLRLWKMVSQSYRTTTGNWHQTWIWFEDNFKGFRVQIEILAVVFDWISKQQLNFLLLLLDWSCRKLGLTYLPSHDGKVTSDKKMILIFHHINKGGNGDYWSCYSVIFETTSKFPIAFLWLVSGKLVVDGVTGPQRESDMGYESDLKIILKNLKCKIEILATVFGWISKHQSNLLLFLLNWYCRKLGLTDLNINFLNIFRHKFYFKPILQVLECR